MIKAAFIGFQSVFLPFLIRNFNIFIEIWMLGQLSIDPVSQQWLQLDQRRSCSNNARWSSRRLAFVTIGTLVIHREHLFCIDRRFPFPLQLFDIVAVLRVKIDRVSILFFR